MLNLAQHLSVAGVTLTRDEVDARPWEPFEGLRGVTWKPLFDDAGLGWGPGLMRLEAGAHVPRHTHRNSAHHIWVLDGRCWIRGKALEAGSYAYVPARVEHAVHEAGPKGCTLLYLYLPGAEERKRVAS
ncbi:MAG: cupin domain-containing protein [Actinomycetota bacterium]